MRRPRRLFLALLATACSLASPAAAGLITEYQFNNNFNDSVGSRNGTGNGTTSFSSNVPSVGVHGPLSLSVGGAGFMSFGPSASDTVSGNYTVALWVNEGDAGGGTFLGTRTGSDQSFDAKLQSGSQVHGDIGTGAGWLTTSADAVPGGGFYSPNTWYHIAYAVSPTGYTIYVNGVNVGSGGFSGTPLLWDQTHKLGVGAFGGGGGENYTGLINDVRIYDSTLTQAQVQSLVPEPAGLVLAAIGACGLCCAAWRRRRMA